MDNIMLQYWVKLTEKKNPDESSRHTLGGTALTNEPRAGQYSIEDDILQKIDSYFYIFQRFKVETLAKNTPIDFRR